MPNTGPSAGSRKQISAFLPMMLSASPRPTVVVVLPSPAGVGEIAVTSTSLPLGLPSSLERYSSEIFALYLPKASRASSGIPRRSRATSLIRRILAAWAMSMLLSFFVFIGGGSYGAGHGLKPPQSEMRAVGFHIPNTLLVEASCAGEYDGLKPRVI